MSCSIAGCNNKHEAHGLCKVHYNKAVRKGDIRTGLVPRGRPKLYSEEERKERARERARIAYQSKPKRIKYNRTDNPCYYLWNNAKRRSSELNLPFDLDLSDLIIPSTCPLLGIPIIKGYGEYSDNSPTLDRIIPERGYVKDNIWIISMRANRIKNDASITELEQIYTNLKFKLDNLSLAGAARCF